MSVQCFLCCVVVTVFVECVVVGLFVECVLSCRAVVAVLTECAFATVYCVFLAHNKEIHFFVAFKV